MAAGEPAREAYLKRAAEWRRRYDERAERIDAWMEEQKSYLSGGDRSSLPR